jgi:hypothetical protein
VLTFQINVCAAPGTLLQRLAHADRMVALSQEHGLPSCEFEARIARHAIHVCLIAPEAAARDAARATQLAELLDTDQARGRALVPELWQAFMQGELDVMERLSQQAGVLARDDVHLRNVWMFRSATIAMMRGGPVEDMVNMCERLFDGLNGMIGLRAFLASAYASMRRPDAALQHFDAVAHDDFRALPKGLNWLTEMSFMADAACRLADRPRAQRVYDALLPYASEFTLFGGEVCPGMPLSYWLAELATTLGDYARAEHWLERSDASCKALRADMLLAYSHMARARLLFLSTPAAAHEQARAILRGIVGFCEARQLRWLSQLAQGLEAECLQLRKRLTVAAPPARLRIVAP